MPFKALWFVLYVAFEPWWPGPSIPAPNILPFYERNEISIRFWQE